MRQSKTLYSNRRHQFVQSEDYTSYMEKRFAKGICLTFNSEEIWTETYFERERGAVDCVVCRPTDRLSTRGRMSPQWIITRRL